jgi:hypothetical protein
VSLIRQVELNFLFSQDSVKSTITTLKHSCDGDVAKTVMVRVINNARTSTTLLAAW